MVRDECVPRSPRLNPRRTAVRFLSSSVDITSVCVMGSGLTRFRSVFRCGLFGLLQQLVEVTDLEKPVVVHRVPVLREFSGAPPVAERIAANAEIRGRLRDTHIFIQLGHRPPPQRARRVIQNYNAASLPNRGTQEKCRLGTRPEKRGSLRIAETLRAITRETGPYGTEPPQWTLRATPGPGQCSRRLLRAPIQSLLSFGHARLINITANETSPKIQTSHSSSWRMTIHWTCSLRRRLESGISVWKMIFGRLERGWGGSVGDVL